jgi:hypothetical protein
MKADSDFPPNDKMRDGLDSQCRDCRRERARESYHRRRGQTTPSRSTTNRPQGPRVYDDLGDLLAKTCADCDRMLPVDQFGKNKRTRDGLTTYCRECHNVRGRKSLEANGGARHYHLFRRYGIDAAEVDAMIEAQKGKCAACRERKAEHVDHDHDTGKVRGILCFTCNVALGNVGDDPGRLMALIGYLAAHGVAPRHTLTANTRRLTGAPGAFRDEIGPGVWRLRTAA